MTATNRLGTALLLTWAVALTALMGYTLIGVGPESLTIHPGMTGIVDPTAEVVAVFPDPEDWRDFREGVDTLRRQGVLKVDEQPAEETVVIITPRHGRRVRFTWDPARGVVETRQAVRRRIGSASPPLAFIGSSNTALTAALADELRSAGNPLATPLLLIPWATAVNAHPSEGSPPEPLLAIHPGRSFRFCLNNQREADLVVGCLMNRMQGEGPSRVLMVVDPADPYSADLASCFEKAIGALVPKAKIVAYRDVIAHGGIDVQPSPEDLRWAEGIAGGLIPAKGGDGRPAWIVLPLQSEPSRRLLGALRIAIRAVLPKDAPPIEVLCGDGIGLASLGEYAGVRPLSIWCASAASNIDTYQDAPQDVQISAEIVGAIVGAVDRAGPLTPESLREGLAGLDFSPDGPSDPGRSLQFNADGERRGDHHGRVFHVGPDQAEILSFRKGRSGEWAGPTIIRPPQLEARR